MALIDDIYSNNLGVLYCFMYDTSGPGMSLINGTGTYNNVAFATHSVLAGLDPVDTSIGFNGTTSYCDITAIVDYALPDNFTIFSAFRPSSATGSRSVFENDKYGIWVDTGVIKFRYVTTGPVTHDLSSGVTVATGRRYAVFVVHTGTEIKLYVDSILKATVAVGSLVTPSGNPQLGRRLGGTAFFAGDIGRSGLLGQALDETTLIFYSNSIIALSFEVDEDVGVDSWTETDYAGVPQSQSIDESMFIDWDWSETLYAGLPQSQIVFDNLNLSDTIARHGTFRDHANDNITITQVVNHINPYYRSITEVINLTQTQSRAGSFRPLIGQQIDELAEGLILQGSQEFFIHEFISLHETLRIQGIALVKSVSDILVLSQSTAIEWGITNITLVDILTLSENLGLRLPIWSPIITQQIIFTEQVNRQFIFSVTDTIIFTQATNKVIPKSLVDLLTFTEAFVLQKVRPTSDTLVFFEDLCSRSVFNRTVTDQLTLTDRTSIFGSDPGFGTNNPTFVGWTDLTEAEWNSLTTDQWNNLLTTSPTGNTGTVNWPYSRTIKIKQHITLIEKLDRFGGIGDCDLVTIVSVQKTGTNTLKWTFSGPVVVLTGGTIVQLVDSSLSSAGQPISTTQGGLREVICTYSAIVSIGDSWAVGVGFAFLNTYGPFFTPVSGIVT